MIRIMPKWFGEAKDRIKREVSKIANENNIKLSFVWDSKAIDDGISAILTSLVHISENAHPEFEDKELQEIRELKKQIKQQEEELPDVKDNTSKKS